MSWELFLSLGVEEMGFCEFRFEIHNSPLTPSTLVCNASSVYQRIVWQPLCENSKFLHVQNLTLVIEAQIEAPEVFSDLELIRRVEPQDIFHVRRDIEFDSSPVSHNAAESKTVDKPAICHQHVSKGSDELSVTDVERIPVHRLLTLTNPQKEKIAKLRGLDPTRSQHCCLTFFGLTQVD
jgi:hypothetical protein